MANVTATQLAREIRDPGGGFGPNAPPPPPFLAKPTTVGRTAVRRVHDTSSAAARHYLNQILAGELSHQHAATRTKAENTVAGLETYIGADRADGRTFEDFGRPIPVTMASGVVKTTVDVIVSGPDGLAGRAIFWDGPAASLADAEAIAYPFAEAMQIMFPNENITDICVWQVRRGNIHSIPLQTALARRAQADIALARL